MRSSFARWLRLAAALACLRPTLAGYGEHHVLRWEAPREHGSLPPARCGAALAPFELDDESSIYMFGGCSEVACFDDLWKYDQHSGRWGPENVAGGKPPGKRSGHTASMLAPERNSQLSRLCVFGGWAGNGPVPSGLKCFDVASRTWGVPNVAGTPPPARWAHTATNVSAAARPAPRPAPSRGPSLSHSAPAPPDARPRPRLGLNAPLPRLARAQVDTDRVLVFGGEGSVPGQYFNDLYLFEGVTDQWSQVATKGAGATGSETSSEMSSSGAGEPTVPAPRMGHSATVVREALYVWAGYTQELRGSRHVRVAQNDLWVLDLRDGVQGEMSWLSMPTVGKAPAARGFHSAASAAGNLFVLGGCDEGEGACYNDIHMLDTEYYDGMRWTELPVGLQRFAPRHQLLLWVGQDLSGYDGPTHSSLIVEGGCSPAMASVGVALHCYSDQWGLQLGNLLHGAKTLNISANGTVVESAEQAEDGERNPLVEYGNNPAELTWPDNLKPGTRRLHPSPSPLPSPSPSPGGSGGAGGGVDAPWPLRPSPTPTPLAPQPSSGGMDKVTGPSIAPPFADAACTYTNLSRCAQTLLLQTTPALSDSLLVADTSAFKLGRYIRINPGRDTQEDSKIVGFGRRLSPAEVNELAEMAARDAAESAVERDSSPGAYATAQTWTLQHSAAASRVTTRMVDRRQGAGGGGGRSGMVSLLQTGEGAAPNALQPQPQHATGTESAGGRPDMSILKWTGVNFITQGGGSSSSSALPRAASQRIHGRELHYFLNLSRPLLFAHIRGEGVLMLPEATHNYQANPLLQHNTKPTTAHHGYTQSPPPPPQQGTAVAAAAEAAAAATAAEAAASAGSIERTSTFGGSASGGQQQAAASRAAGGAYTKASARRAARGGRAGHAGGSVMSRLRRSAVSDDDAGDEEDEAVARELQAVRTGTFAPPPPCVRNGTGANASCMPAGTLAPPPPSSSSSSSSGSESLRQKLEDLYERLPPWAWIAIGSSALLCCCCCVVQCVRSRSRRKARKKAGLEDIQPVFQTETWRKLS